MRPRQKRRFRPCTTDSRHGHKVAENRLTKVPRPDRLRDLAEGHHFIETQEGERYHCRGSPR